ncbi:MAG TPA: Xaa-Pro peptidase family protein [Candidatus Limnocylindria bacterium]|nr:Xaa-Pro peptidase family protein [Candidatus Limnocylindria bacterium]
MKNGAPLLLFGDSYRFPDIYHSIRFLAPDPQIVLEQDGEIVMLTNALEEARARKQSRATKIENVDDYGARELRATMNPITEATAAVIERFLLAHAATRISVPQYFPVGLADRLRAKGIDLAVVEGLELRRRAKRDDEIAALAATQRATEEAWQLGVDAIATADVRPDGTLALDGAPLTAERVRSIVEGALLERGCLAESTIIAPGTQAADPHQTGSGPIRAREAVVMDIFPQHKETRYFADMTRTISKGAPSAELVKMYEVVMRAQDAGIKALRPGITGREVHELVEDLIFAAGYDTLREGQKHDPNDPVTRGFIHGTGHGVGLEIHEAPSIGRAGSSPLAIGDVVTVEPGIYDPALGGVRLEDMLVITAKGSRNLTRAPRQLVV